MKLSSPAHSTLRAALFVYALILPTPAAAAQICDLSFKACPDNFNGDTIFAPEDVVALSPTIFACHPTWVVEGAEDTTKPPSLVFVIDNSGSMFRGDPGVAPHDQWGSRFTVFHQLLDSIRAIQPRTEVSVIVFQERLFFDVTTGQYYTRYFKTLPTVTDGVTQQAYLQFMRLDSVYANGKTGLQVIEDVLLTDTGTVIGPNGAVTADTLVYKPAFTLQPSTNINVAFRAAREVLKTAANPVDRRYVIFFSDGLPCCTDTADGLPAYNFQKGLGLPTTFTVFFTNPGAGVPASIDTMTRNIQNNGYSVTNPKSAYWGITTSHDALLSLLLNNIMATILSVKTGTPKSMTVNGVPATSLSDTQFIFTSRFALDKDVTHFNFTVHYTYEIVVGGKATGTVKDTTVVVDFYVKRQTGVVLPQGVTEVCWQQATLDLYYNGQPVTVVNETMDTLETRFVQGGAPVSSVSVIVKTKTAGDNETFALANKGAYWSARFPRFIATAVPGDQKLQNAQTDSIVLIYRNPDLPLDTIRKAYPFALSRSITLGSATYYDNNADGYVDSILVTTNATLSAADLTALGTWITLPAVRGFSAPRYVAVSGGFAIVTQESTASPPKTSVGPGDTIVIHGGGILPGGGIVNNGVIHVTDRVAPVIVRASVTPTPSGHDSLVVYFAESVTPIVNSLPFLFRRAGGDSVQQQLTFVRVRDDGGFLFAINGTDYLLAGDSIWMNPPVQIGDTVGNHQTNPDNRRVALQVASAPYTVIPHAINNPLTFAGKLTVPDPIRALTGYKQDYGLILSVEPQRALRVDDSLAGTVSIYDVVKNPIVAGKKMAPDPITHRLYFVWDGRNSKGRSVATGTYLAIFDVWSNKGLRQHFPLRIGVKR